MDFEVLYRLKIVNQIPDVLSKLLYLLIIQNFVFLIDKTPAHESICVALEQGM